MITVGEYTDLFLTVILGLGLVFEMPILIFFLALMGVVGAGFLWRNFRYAILVIFFIAAIVTPTTDIVNMCIFAAPMVGLYVLSIGIAWLVASQRRKARARARHEGPPAAPLAAGAGAGDAGVQPGADASAAEEPGSQFPRGSRGGGPGRERRCAGACPGVNADARAIAVRPRDGRRWGRGRSAAPRHGKLEAYLRAHLKGDRAGRPIAFTASSPRAGPSHAQLHRASYPGTKDGVDRDRHALRHPLLAEELRGRERRRLRHRRCSLALADQLRGERREGYTVWLVWLDGEEALKNWIATPIASTAAGTWPRSGEGRHDEKDQGLPPAGHDRRRGPEHRARPELHALALLDLVRAAASRLGYQSHFFRRQMADGGRPPALRARRRPGRRPDRLRLRLQQRLLAHLGRHLDKLSPRSLGIVGDVVLESVRMLGQ